MAASTASQFLRMWSMLLLFFACFSSIVPCGSCERTIKLVHLLYRHGDRSPVKAYPNDNYTEDTWPLGFGQLTENGMAQHYDLGQWLRKRYVTDLKLFDGTYRPKQFYVQSTSKERTVMSAQSNLQGFFPVASEGRESSTLWPPVPVFSTVNTGQDYLLHPTKLEGCDTASDFFQYVENCPPKQKYIKDNQTFFDRIQKNAGFSDDVVFRNFSTLADTLLREKRDGRKLPDWVEDETFNRLKATLDFAFEVEYSNMTTDEKRINSGVLLTEMVGNMKAHLNQTNVDSKIFMYSAHDTTVAPFLGMFGVFNNVIPPTASCIMVELYREDDGSHTVQLLFRNDTSKPPYVLKFLDCNEVCPVENFFHIASPFLVDDIDAMCRRKPPSLPLHVEWNIGWMLAASTLAFAALLPFIACVILTCGVGGRRRLHNSKKRMEPINFHLLGGNNSESEDESVFDT
nr:prostatic acid phosphatase-like isoform X1 [Lytechinus pictus]